MTTARSIFHILFPFIRVPCRGPVANARTNSGLLRAALIQRRVALCALLLLCGASSRLPADDPKPLTAILLIGKSDLPDDDFANSVVLVMNNLGPAPIGIVVNRPTRITVPQLFPDVARLARLHDRVYFGGPVEFGAIWFLVRAAAPPEHTMQAFDSVYVSADRELLLKLLNRPKPMDGLRIFVGHAGWAPGQLEAEVDRGAWTLQRADPDAIFNGKSEHLWPAPRVPKDRT
jgi:putative transcriptional regulator